MITPSLKNPRYVWVEVEATEQLKKLYSLIINRLRLAGIKFKKDRYSFHPHVTIGRVRRGEWGSLEKKGGISDVLNWSISVNSFEIMESFLGRFGARYVTLQSHKIGS